MFQFHFFFAGHLSDEEVIAIFQRLADYCREVLAQLKSLPAQKNAHAEDSLPCRDRFFMMLTLDYGIRMTEANLAWFEEVIVRLQRGEHKG